MGAIIASGIEFSIFFYNPNIHHKKEYELRKEENIRFAEKHDIPFIDADYDVISSALGISRWKNMGQINGSGIRAAGRYQGITYWTHNWLKNGGASRMLETSKKEKFYMQEYSDVPTL